MKDKVTAVLIAIVYAVGLTIIATLAATDYGQKCVPGNAINYDGTLEAWTDRQGVVVLMAAEEDSYPFCQNP